VGQGGGEKLYNLEVKVLRKKPVRLGECRVWIRGIWRSLALAAAFAGHEMRERDGAPSGQARREKGEGRGEGGCHSSGRGGG
jgi:hypothetical protein